MALSEENRLRLGQAGFQWGHILPTQEVAIAARRLRQEIAAPVIAAYEGVAEGIETGLEELQGIRRYQVGEAEDVATTMRLAARMRAEDRAATAAGVQRMAGARERLFEVAEGATVEALDEPLRGELAGEVEAALLVGRQDELVAALEAATGVEIQGRVAEERIRRVFGQMQQFRRRHPALENLGRREEIQEGLNELLQAATQGDVVFEGEEGRQVAMSAEDYLETMARENVRREQYREIARGPETEYSRTNLELAAAVLRERLPEGGDEWELAQQIVREQRLTAFEGEYGDPRDLRTALEVLAQARGETIPEMTTRVGGRLPGWAREALPAAEEAIRAGDEEALARARRRVTGEQFRAGVERGMDLRDEFFATIGQDTQTERLVELIERGALGLEEGAVRRERIDLSRGLGRELERFREEGYAVLDFSQWTHEALLVRQEDLERGTERYNKMIDVAGQVQQELGMTRQEKIERLETGVAQTVDKMMGLVTREREEGAEAPAIERYMEAVAEGVEGEALAAMEEEVARELGGGRATELVLEGLREDGERTGRMVQAWQAARRGERLPFEVKGVRTAFTREITPDVEEAVRMQERLVSQIGEAVVRDNEAFAYLTREEGWFGEDRTLDEFVRHVERAAGEMMEGMDVERRQEMAFRVAEQLRPGALKKAVGTAVKATTAQGLRRDIDEMEEWIEAARETLIGEMAAGEELKGWRGLGADPISRAFGLDVESRLEEVFPELEAYVNTSETERLEAASKLKTAMVKAGFFEDVAEDVMGWMDETVEEPIQDEKGNTMGTREVKRGQKLFYEFKERQAEKRNLLEDLRTKELGATEERLDLLRELRRGGPLSEERIQAFKEEFKSSYIDPSVFELFGEEATIEDIKKKFKGIDFDVESVEGARARVLQEMESALSGISRKEGEVISTASGLDAEGQRTQEALTRANEEIARVMHALAYRLGRVEGSLVKASIQ